MPTQDRGDSPGRDRSDRSRAGRKRPAQPRTRGEAATSQPPKLEDESAVLYATRESLETGAIRIVQAGVRVAEAIEVLSQGELARQIQAGHRLYVMRGSEKSYLGLAINARGLIELSADAVTLDVVSHLPPCDEPTKGKIEYQVEHVTRRRVEGGRSRISRCSVRIGETVYRLGEQELIRHLQAGGRLYVLKNRARAYLDLSVAAEGFVFVNQSALAEMAAFSDEEDPSLPEFVPPQPFGSPESKEPRRPPTEPPERSAAGQIRGIYAWLAILSLIVVFLLIRSCAAGPAPAPTAGPTPTVTIAPPTSSPAATTLATFTEVSETSTSAPAPTTAVPPATTPAPAATTAAPAATTPAPTTPMPSPTTPAAPPFGPTIPPPPPITPPSAAQLTAPHPKGMVSDPATNRLFVAARGVNQVIVLDEKAIPGTEGTIDASALIATVKNITVPFGIGVLNSKVYVAENGSDSVGVIDAQNPASPAETIGIASGSGCRSASETHGPSHVAVNPATDHVYVTLHDGTSQVAVIDADTREVDCLDANAGAFGIAANPKFGHFYVGDRDALDLRVYADPEKGQPPVFQTAIPVMVKADPYADNSPTIPASPFYMAVSPDGTQLYVAAATNCKERATPQHNCDLVNQVLVYGIDAQGGLSAMPKFQLAIAGNNYDGGWILQSACASNKLYVAETNDDPAVTIRTVTTFNGDLTPDQVSVAAFESQDGGEPFSLAENVGLGRIYVSYKYYGDDTRGRLAFVTEAGCK